MPALHEKLRKQLEKTVIAARDIAEDAATEALKGLAVDRGKAFDHMTPDGRELRKKLRAKARQLGDRRDKAGKQAIDHLAVECAYEHWHRMLFARFLAENHLLIHGEEGVPVSIEECEELAKDEGIDGWTLAARFASRMLPQIFRPDDPVLAVTLAPESKRALEKMLDTLPPEVFTAADSLGWVYQFWQAKRKDEVNASGVKIGADELPAVTQLFTEHYMVLFLLHNTLGAWWAGKVLQNCDAHQSRDREGADKQELSEDQWRSRVALPGCDFEYLRFLDDGTPAAGTFSGWPKDAKELKILDPCCGSGHFLVASFDLMVRIRIKEEGLSPSDACDAVLRDNIFGLEIDQRCTQIAAFALALAAWRFPKAGGYRELPELHIACSGIAPHATEEQWLDLAEQSGVPMPAIGKQPIREGLRNLHALFSQAPTLGSLIDPSELPGDLIAADYETLQPYLAAALTAEHTDDEAHQRVVAAAGMVKAAELLGYDYDLVVTNPPFLGLEKQVEALEQYIKVHYPEAKRELALCFFERCARLLSSSGTSGLVLPGEWTFVRSHRAFRKYLLGSARMNMLARLGAGAFASPIRVTPVLLVSSRRGDATAGTTTRCLDVGAMPLLDKPRGLACADFVSVLQESWRAETDCRLLVATTPTKSEGMCVIGSFADARNGLSAGDGARFESNFWEVASLGNTWEMLQSSTAETQQFGGRERIVRWENETGEMAELAASVRHLNHAAQNWRRGKPMWGRVGIIVNQIGAHTTIYAGDKYDGSCFAIVPNEEHDAASLAAFALKGNLKAALKKINPTWNLKSPKTLLQLPLELDKWRQVATEIFSNGLPEPESDDPTQWLFHGRPEVSTSPLQVGGARLLGYRWPPELDQKMRLSKRARAMVKRCGELSKLVDDDGIVCIPPVRGERAATDRVRGLLAAAYGNEWSPAKQEELLASVGYGGKSLDEWLSNGFAEQHYKLFHHRPFIWHIWDGRKKDGFGALVNYHMLDAKLLDRLIYTYLGDWIKRQEQAVAQGESGADARLLAAQQLQEKLKLIAEGEPPYDIFVRWKPIEEQAIGWNPDLNDGVRMNIRPFMEANILRKKPNIKWKKDRGKEPHRPQEQYPWFYDENGEPTGDRVNDVHLTIAEKQSAREKVGVA